MGTNRVYNLAQLRRKQIACRKQVAPMQKRVSQIKYVKIKYVYASPHTSKEFIVKMLCEVKEMRRVHWLTDWLRERSKPDNDDDDDNEGETYTYYCIF